MIINILKMISHPLGNHTNPTHNKIWAADIIDRTRLSLDSSSCAANTIQIIPEIIDSIQKTIISDSNAILGWNIAKENNTHKETKIDHLVEEVVDDVEKSHHKDLKTQNTKLKEDSLK